MPSIRFRLEKPTLTGLAQRVAEQYGPEARIVDTEESVVGGFGGLFGKRVVDVTVELPDRAPEAAHEFSMRTRVGLAALLEDADAQDHGPATQHGSDPWATAPPAAQVSTQGGDFASVLDSLRIDVEEAGEAGGGTPARPPRPRAAEPPLTPMVFTPVRPTPPAPRARAAAYAAIEAIERPVVRALPAAPAPAPTRRQEPERRPPTPHEIAVAEQAAQQVVWATPSPRSRVGGITPGAPPPVRTGPGDLLLLIGLGDDAMTVAKALRDRLQRGYVCDGGTIEGNTRRRVDDRRGAVAARAYAVRSEQPVIVAYGLGRGDVDDPRHSGLLTIDSDQAWLVVDESRRPDETLEWAGRLRGRLQVDAVASVRGTGAERHAALSTIGLPEAWRELAG